MRRLRGIRLDTRGFDHPRVERRVERLVGDERALDVDGEAVSFLQSLGRSGAGVEPTEPWATRPHWF
jgi:hypothetical protein